MGEIDEEEGKTNRLRLLRRSTSAGAKERYASPEFGLTPNMKVKNEKAGGRSRYSFTG